MTVGGPGLLYVVSTPIGNMGDFSFRAVEVLRQVASVLAEDTRHSRHLLDRYEIATPLIPYHEHNEAKTAPRLIQRMLAGEQLALISDAGTPLLSDPGARLVRATVEAGLTVTSVPGASALLAALVVSGLSLERFTFYGFLPRKGAERRSAIREIVGLRHAAVIYEAPSRVGPTLSELSAAGAGIRATVVARELTKQFEELRRGTVGDLAAYYESVPPRGEVVIVVAGGSVPVAASEGDIRTRAIEMRAAGLTARSIAAALQDELGASRNVAYRLARE